MASALAARGVASPRTRGLSGCATRSISTSSTSLRRLPAAAKATEARIASHARQAGRSDAPASREPAQAPAPATRALPGRVMRSRARSTRGNQGCCTWGFGSGHVLHEARDLPRGDVHLAQVLPRVGLAVEDDDEAAHVGDAPVDQRAVAVTHNTRLLLREVQVAADHVEVAEHRAAHHGRERIDVASAFGALGEGEGQAVGGGDEGAARLGERLAQRAQHVLHAVAQVGPRADALLDLLRAALRAALLVEALQRAGKLLAEVGRVLVDVADGAHLEAPRGDVLAAEARDDDDRRAG